MTTYADIITLLLAFFVILFSMSTLKKEFFNQITEEIVEGQKRGFAQKIQTFQANRIPEESPVIYRVFVPALEDHNYLKSVIGIEEQNEVHKSQLIFPEESLFIPNTTTLTNKAKLILRDTVTYLNQLDENYFDISIQSYYEKDGTIPNEHDKFRFTAERGLVIRNMLQEKGYTKNQHLCHRLWRLSAPKKVHL